MKKTTKKMTKLQERRPKILTVDEFCEALNDLKKIGISGESEIWLSSGGERNSFSPLVLFPNGALNVVMDSKKNKLILYPLR